MNRPLFGYGGEERPRKGRPTIKRDQGGHERWADAILPADAEAGIIETPTNRRPLIAVVALVVAASAVLAGQLFRLQIIEGQRNLGLAEGNRLRQKITRAPRGVIYDRSKNILAQNLAGFDVTVTPSLLPKDDQQRQALYGRVGSLLQMPAEDVARKAEGDCVATQNAAKISPQRAKFDCLGAVQPRLIASNVDREAALNLDQSVTSVPGFSLDTNPIREYKDEGLLSAILGYTGRVNAEEVKKDPTYGPNDFIGKLGIERNYEELLKGQNGTEQTEVDATGRPVKLLGSKPSVSGSNVVLSVDMELQRKMTDAIQTQMNASGSRQASGVALNPKTGEVLAAVNLPGYDNNLFAKGISQADYDRLLDDRAQPLFNKAIGGSYPVGSVIKPLIGSAALQEKVVGVNTSVEDKGALEVPNQYDPKITYTFRSYEPGGLGVVNITRAIAVSSNVFFYTVGGGYGNIKGLGVERLVKYYEKFGLGRKLGVDIPEETAGLVPSPASKKKATGEGWFLGDTFNISVGQGDLRASPLQMAAATAAVANGGTLYRPHFLREVQDPGGRTVQAVQPKIISKDFISPQNIETIRRAMRQVVDEPYGTACCQIKGSVPVSVGAKTGTAETDPGGNRKPHAWFTAFAPYEDPQIVIVVLIQNAGEGSKFALPAVRDTLAWCFTRPGGCVQ